MMLQGVAMKSQGLGRWAGAVPWTRLASQLPSTRLSAVSASRFHTKRQVLAPGPGLAPRTENFGISFQELPAYGAAPPKSLRTAMQELQPGAVGALADRHAQEGFGWFREGQDFPPPSYISESISKLPDAVTPAQPEAPMEQLDSETLEPRLGINPNELGMLNNKLENHLNSEEESDPETPEQQPETTGEHSENPPSPAVPAVPATPANTPEEHQPEIPAIQQQDGTVDQQPNVPVGQQPNVPVGQQPNVPVGQQQPEIPANQQPNVPVNQQQDGPGIPQQDGPVDQQQDGLAGQQPEVPAIQQPNIPVNQQPGTPSEPDSEFERHSSDSGSDLGDFWDRPERRSEDSDGSSYLGNLFDFGAAPNGLSNRVVLPPASGFNSELQLSNSERPPTPSPPSVPGSPETAHAPASGPGSNSSNSEDDWDRNSDSEPDWKDSNFNDGLVTDTPRPSPEPTSPGPVEAPAANDTNSTTNDSDDTISITSDSEDSETTSTTSDSEETDSEAEHGDDEKDEDYEEPSDEEESDDEPDKAGVEDDDDDLS